MDGNNLRLLTSNSFHSTKLRSLIDQLSALGEAAAVKAGGGHRLTFSGLRRSTCVELSCTA